MSAAKAAIVGVGESKIGRVPDRSATQLLADAARAAAQDAGIAVHDIDGIVTAPISIGPWTSAAVVMSNVLGLKPKWFATINLAGATGAAMIHQAAQAVMSGQCETVLCLGGENLLTSSSGGGTGRMAEAGSPFETPYGPLVPSLYALAARRHMHEYGTTEEQLAEVAVAIRYHASLNPNAHKPNAVTLEEVMASRMISSPLKVLDCALISDGAGAAIVTTPERARDLRRPPVYLLGQGYGVSHGEAGEARTLTTSGAVQSGEDAYRTAGIGPQDVDVAELYDCFTITVIVELEDLGFCAKGEGGSFVEGGRIRLGGDLPVTTHGGLLSAGHFGLGAGFLHALEGVRQLRGEAGKRQVDGAEIALVHGNGGILACHCTLVLGAQAAA